MDHKNLVHAALSGLLALPDNHAEAIIDQLTSDILECLKDQLMESDEDLLWLREAIPAGHA